MRVGDLARVLGAPAEGDQDLVLTGVASVEAAGASELSFAGGRNAGKLAADSGAGCLLVPPDFPAGRTLIRVADPRTAFVQAVYLFHPPRRPAPGAHPSAVVNASAQLGDGVSVGPLAVLGECSIGAGTSIGAGCRVADGVTIGAECTLHPGVTVYEGSVIGERVILHSGCVIGADGFGFTPAGGRWHKFPQVGRVRIDNDVEIGANSCVDRAALGETVIGEGTKIDNLVHIAHNCRIGRHVVIAAQTGFSGAVVVEDRAIVGGQVGVGDHARIETGAVIGSGAGILTKKIVKGGDTYWGTPARPLREHLEQLAHVARLPKLRKEIDAILERLDHLESR